MDILLNLLRSYQCLLIFNLLVGYLHAQENVILKGETKSLGILLGNTNILAFPIQDAETKFAISNEKGEYQLKLEKGVTYSIEVSYLGYKKLVFEHTATQDETKDLVPTPKTNELRRKFWNLK